MEAVSKYVTVLVKRCSMFLDNMTVNVKFSLSVSWMYGGAAGYVQLRSVLTSVLVGGEWSICAPVPNE